MSSDGVGVTCVYRDQNGVDHAAIVTGVQPQTTEPIEVFAFHSFGRSATSAVELIGAYVSGFLVIPYGEHAQAHNHSVRRVDQHG